MSRLEHVIARNVIELRTERGWTQADLATRMRNNGFTWQTNRVTQLETLRRPVALLELVGLTRSFGVPVARLLSGDDEVDLPCGDTMPVEDVRDALEGHDRFMERLANPSPEALARWSARNDELKRIAAKLDVSRRLFDHACQMTYGHDIIKERDARLGSLDGVSAGSARTMKGHATRALLAELRVWFGTTDEDRFTRMREIEDDIAAHAFDNVTFGGDDASR